MKTIVALVDFSDLTFKVLKQAHAHAKAFNSEVIILHMVPNDATLVDTETISPLTMEDPSPKVVQKHYAQLLEMRDSLINYGVRATVRQLNGADVNDVLAESKKLNADLIILGSHHHGAFYNMLVGSVPNDVLKHAHCPVLVVPSDAGEHPVARPTPVNADAETTGDIARLETEAPIHESVSADNNKDQAG